jgi:hypothetical protein
MDTIIQLFSKLKEDKKENVELEVRFRCVDKYRVENILEYLKPSEYTKYKETRVPIPGIRKGFHRIIKYCNEPKRIQSKTQIHKESIYDEWISIVLSIEEDLNRSLAIVSGYEIEKERWTYVIDNMGKIDITVGDNLYQVELEIFRIDWKFMEKVREISMIMLDSPEFLSRTLSDCVSRIIHENYENIFRIIGRKFQLPQTMDKSSYIKVFRGDFFVTPKLDGQRRFLIIFNGQIFSVDLKGVIRRESSNSKYNSDACCILDCEYLEGSYYAIDVPVLDGEYIGDKFDPIERGKLITDYGIDITTNENFIRTKEYKMVKKDPSSVFHFSNEWNKKHEMDGVIFVEEKYSGECLKLKYEITVDLLLDEDWNMITSDKKIIISNIGFISGLTVGKIYEFVVTDNSELQFLRIRDDKPFPNSSKIVSRNISENTVSMKNLQGRECLMMRKMHNKVKNLMYKMSKVEGSIVLDIGTGQGGDLSKWEKSKKVYCVEPKKEALQ